MKLINEDDVTDFLVGMIVICAFLALLIIGALIAGVLP